MIAQDAMAFNSLRWPHADPYSVPQIVVALKSFLERQGRSYRRFCKRQFLPKEMPSVPKPEC